MEFRIGSLKIQVKSGDRAIKRSLQSILKGWPSLILDPSPNEPGNINLVRGLESADITITIKIVDRLPSLPKTKPFFVENIAGNVQESGTITLFRSDNDFRLFFRGGAVVQYSLSGELPSYGSIVEIETVISAAKAGQIEDILFSSLAPFLRRHGYYLVHSFAASRDDLALLLVGESGSGKTTAGLSLIQQGWGYLANDMILLKKEGDSIWAFPTPGGISITPKTAEILSSLISDGSTLSEAKANRKEYYPAVNLVSSWSEAVPVGTICFPTISAGSNSKIIKIQKATALAQIMEGSIDRWDDAMLIKHVDFLERLCDQAQCLGLQLGEDVGELSRILSTTWD